MRFGICCGPGSFAPQVVNQPLSEVPALLDRICEAGAEYVEFPVGAVSPFDSEAKFEELLKTMQKAPLRAEAFNSFIPAQHRITGPDVKLADALAFCRTSLRRCKLLGGEVVVLGSSGARRYPAGFDAQRAQAQFVKFVREVAAIAGEIGIVVALEPLNSKEDNLLTSVAQGMALCQKLEHPNIQLLADSFHMFEDNEPFDVLPRVRSRLVHVHVASRRRGVPGAAPEDVPDFAGFFGGLRRAGYDSRCSFEGRFDDINAQCKPLLGWLRTQWRDRATV